MCNFEKENRGRESETTGINSKKKGELHNKR
jgi:hypothetical protein